MKFNVSLLSNAPSISFVQIVQMPLLGAFQEPGYFSYQLPVVQCTSY